MIVDDDSVARTGLKTMIEWKEHGFQLCGEASNGQNALDAVEREHPDIVITDISMPVMDGVMLIERIHAAHPEIVTIALSGFNDFDYVRESMKGGALDYILKYRLDPQTLLANLETASRKIIRQQNENDQRKHLSEQNQTNREALKLDLFNRLLYGEVKDKKELTSMIQSGGLHIGTQDLAAVIAEIDDFPFIEERFSPTEINVLIKSFLDISNEILSEWERAELCHMGRGRFLYVLTYGCFYSRTHAYTQLITMMNRIKNSVSKYLNITACFSIRDNCASIKDLPNCVKEAENALKYRFYKGKDCIIQEEEAESVEDDYFSLDIREEKAIGQALREKDKQEVERLTGKIFGRIIERKISYKSTQMICAELINIINKVAREYGIEVLKLYSSDDVPYQKLQKYNTALDIKEWLMDAFENLIDHMRPFDTNQSYSELIRKTVDYVNCNFRNSISLNDAAEHAGVSPSYLSRTFKEEIGKGFNEYLNTVRVESAKRLIEKEGRDLKNIVKSVGFNSYNYFFKVFKDISGMTPLEYAKAIGKEL